MLYIINQEYEVLAIAQNKGDALPFYDDTHIENLDVGSETYEFTAPGDHPDAEHLVVGNLIVLNNLDGDKVMFSIMETEDTHDERFERRVYCEQAGMQLINEIEDPYKAPSQQHLPHYVNRTIGDTGWTIGRNEATAFLTLEFDQYHTALERLQRIATAFQVELHFTVQMKGSKVVGKKVHFLKQRGANIGKRFVYGKDVTSIVRTVDATEVITAVKGIGSSDENENVTTFKARVYDDGDYYSQAGSDIIYSRKALAQWGRQGGHIFGKLEFDTSNVENLWTRSLNHLKENVQPKVTYEVDTVTLERLSGYEEEKVRVGDTIKVQDTGFNPALYLEARVVQLETSYTDPRSDKVILGNYVLVKSNISDALRALQSQLMQRRATWEQMGEVILKVPEPPADPTEGQLWLDTGKEPALLMVYRSGEWKPASPDSTYIEMKLDELDIIGRNLVRYRNTGGTSWFTGATAIVTEQDGIIRGQSNGVNNPSWPRIANMSIAEAPIEPGKEYTLSYWARSSVAVGRSVTIARSNGQNMLLNVFPMLTEDWKYFEHTFTPTVAPDAQTGFYMYTGGTNGDTTNWVELKEVKLEKGKKATGWTPSPEDMEVRVEDVENELEETNNKVVAIEVTTNDAIMSAEEAKANADFALGKANDALSGLSEAEQQIQVTQDAAAAAQGRADDAFAQAQGALQEAQTKEAAIHKGSSAPTSPVTGKLWLDTSTTPNSFKRWSGSAWVKVTPTVAGDLNAYTITEVNNALNAKVSTSTYTTDKDGILTRLGTAETAITQNETAINLRATKTELDTLTGRVSSAESSLDVQAGQIASKVSQTDFNSLNGRVSSAESSITQQATQIASKVSQVDFNNLSGRVSSAETSITQQAGQINLKADQTVVDGINTRLGSAETKITPEAITNTVRSSSQYTADLNAKEGNITKSNTAPAHLNGRLWLDTSLTPNVLKRSTGSSWVKATPTEASEVGAYSSSDGSALASRVSTAENKITPEAITNTVRTSTLYTQDLAAKEGAVTKANTAPPHVTGRLWLDTSVTPNILKRSTGSAWVNASPTTAAHVGAYSATDGANLAGRVTTAENKITDTAITNTVTNSSIYQNNLAAKANQADLETLSGALDGIDLRVQEAEQSITAEAITSSVLDSQSFLEVLGSKVDAETLAAYATADALEQTEILLKAYADGLIDDIDLSPYVTSTQLTQTKNEFDFLIKSGGGVNLLKNSVGWGGEDFWALTGSGDWEVVTNEPELDSIGSGAAWNLRNRTITQEVAVRAGTEYTFSCMAWKTANQAGMYLEYDDGSGSFKLGPTILTASAYNWEPFSYTFKAVGDTVKIRLRGAGSTSNLRVANVMLNTGTLPMQWTHARDELYNTNIKFSQRGIIVQNNATNGETRITPTEFAGYARNAQGNQERIFTLNGDTTEVKKLQAEEEFAMGSARILYIQSTNATGWSFLPRQTDN